MINLPQQAEQAIRLLEQNGFEAWAVGGCVRDCFLGKSPSDWDLCTNALPDQTKSIFSGYRIIDTGIRHGTITVMIDHMPLEITTYRIEQTYTDHRHPDAVSYVQNVTEDLARRDFTVNAMAYSPSRGLKDPFGGRTDLQNKVLRCVGDDRTRFQEDALRILRLFRFSAQLGFQIDEKSLKAAHECRSDLDLIARERIQAELIKLLLSPAPSEALQKMALISVLERCIPSISWEGAEARTALASISHAPLDLVTRVSLLLQLTETPPQLLSILRELHFDNKTIGQIRTIFATKEVPLTAGQTEIQELLSTYELEALVRQADFQFARQKAQSLQSLPHLEKERARFIQIAKDIVASGMCLRISQLAVSGGDLIGLGMEEGPEIGKQLRTLLDLVKRKKLPNEREALLRYVSGFSEDRKI